MRVIVAFLGGLFVLNLLVALYLARCAPDRRRESLTLARPAAEVAPVLSRWLDEARAVEDGGLEGRRGGTRVLLQPRRDGRSVVLVADEDPARLARRVAELERLLEIDGSAENPRGSRR